MKKSMYTCALALLAALVLFSCQHHNDTSSDATSADSAKVSQQSLSDTYKSAITSIIQQDSALDRSADGIDSLIATGTRTLELSQCPRDFAVAYYDHIV